MFLFDFMKPPLLQKLADTNKLLGRDAIGSESEQDTSCRDKVQRTRVES